MKTPTYYLNSISVKPTEEETAPEKENASKKLKSVRGNIRKRKAEKILKEIEPGQATEKQQRELKRLKKGSLRSEAREEARLERATEKGLRLKDKENAYVNKAIRKNPGMTEAQARERFGALRDISVKSSEIMKNIVGDQTEAAKKLKPENVTNTENSVSSIEIKDVTKGNQKSEAKKNNERDLDWWSK